MIESQIREELNKRFGQGVAESVFEYNSLTALNFLVCALEKHKVDVTNYMLGGRKSGRFVYDSAGKGPNLLCLDTLDLDIGIMKFAILHELGHIIQINKGFMTCDDYHKFWNVKGCEFAISGIEIEILGAMDYNELPWELDANYFAFSSPLCPKPSKKISGNLSVVRKNYPEFKKWM